MVFTVQSHASQSLVIVQEPPVDYSLGKRCATLQLPTGISVELRLGVCVANLEQSPRGHLLYVLLGVHLCPHGLASIA